VFWSDYLSRRSYAIFGDILSFDTTHNTNRYLMVFVPFNGLNYHKQLICFSVGLLRDEKVESFQWLINSFLIATGIHIPKTVITDQDLTITQAIADVFETMVHRFCMWHIMRKLPKKVGRTLNGCEDFIEHINRCVWASDSPDEFEESWGEMLGV